MRQVSKNLRRTFCLSMFQNYQIFGLLVLLLTGLFTLSSAQPLIGLSPNSLSRTIFQGDKAYSVVTISNLDTGSSILNWSATESKTSPGSLSALASGGPDNFGYGWTDSDDSSGVNFNWIDITLSGISVTGVGDDTNTGTYPVGFNFPFYGSSFSTFRIGSNGFITFTSTSTKYLNLSLPTTGAPFNLVAPFWEDLDLTKGGAVFYKSSANQLVVSFVSVQRWNDTVGTVTFQVVLYANGEIRFQYNNMSAATNSATVGIQNSDGSDGLQVAYNQSYLHSQLAIRIVPGVQFLDEIPSFGTVNANQYQIMTVKVDATELPVGDTTGYILINSDDTSNPQLTFPVNLFVAPGSPQLTTIPTELSFGQVFIGQTTQLTLVIKNSGYGTLTATNIYSDSGEFTWNGPASAQLVRNEYVTGTVSFIPATFGQETAFLHILINHGYTIDSLVRMTGQCVALPEISVTPQPLPHMTLMQGSTAFSLMTISNIADSGQDLTYEITESINTTGITAIQKSAARVIPANKPDPFKIQDNVPYVADEVLVKFKTNTASAMRSMMNVHAGTQVMKHYPLIDVYRMKLSSGKKVSDVLATYAQRKDIVEYAEPNYMVKAQIIPNDTYFGNLWGMSTIQAPAAWNIGTGTREIVIGVIDTGVDYTHADLADNIWKNPREIPFNGIDDDSNGYVDDTIGRDCVNNDNDPMDDHYHGTHCAGSIGAKGNDGYGVAGVMWNTRIIPLKFLDASGNGSTADAIECLNYAIHAGANITSNSWGGGGYELSMYAAISAANAAGMLFIAAAGNDGTNNDSIAFYPANYDLPNVIAVGATAENDTLASFSNYGATQVDLAAPGNNIYSTSPGSAFRYLSGTSMATPHVSGAAGLVWSLNPALKNTDVKQILMDTVDKLSTLTGKCVTGGRINLKKAVEKAGISWIDETPKSGTVITDTYSVITLTYSAVNMPIGDTTGFLVIYNNDSSHNPLTVPISMTVTQGIPKISLSETTVALGEVFVHSTTKKTITIKNAGYTILTVTNVAGSGEYTVDAPIPAYLERDASIEVMISFIPSATGPNNGNISIQSNSPGEGNISVILTATVVNPPHLVLVPEQMTNTVPNNGSGYSFMTIANPGTGYASNLDWTVLTDIASTSNYQIQRNGGPDDYGYRFLDSDESNGPIFSWSEITAIGTKISITGDDVNTGTFPIGFTFPFYGNNFTSFRVCSNGFISFTSSSTNYGNTPLPSPDAPENLVAPFWNDFDMSTSGSIYYYSDGSKLVVSFIHIIPYGGGGDYSFQVILGNSGEIRFQYLNITGENRFGTVGIQDAAKDAGLQVAYDDSYLKSNLAVRIVPPVQWLHVNPASGSTPANGFSIVTVTFNALGMTNFDTTAYLWVNTNDPAHLHTSVPVTMHVTENLIADFSADSISGISPLSVQFTDNSYGSPTAWSWSFGDGGTSILQNPQHTYTTDSVSYYDVTLNVINAISADSMIRTAYITVYPNLQPLLQPLPDVKLLKGTTANGVFSLNDYARVTTDWNWSSADGQHQVNINIHPGMNTVDYQTTTNPDFTGKEKILFDMPAYGSAGTTSWTKYSDYLISPLPYVVVDNGVVLKDGSIDLSNYVQPTVPSSWPTPVIRYHNALDDNRLSALITGNQLNINVFGSLQDPAEIIISTNSTLTNYDSEIIRVYEVLNSYAHFANSTDTEQWAFQLAETASLLPSIAYYPEYNNANGVLGVSFSSQSAGIKMTLGIPNWINSSTGQWYTVRARVMCNIPNNKMNVQLKLYNGTSTFMMSGRVLYGCPTTWKWFETSIYADVTSQLYPQFVVNNGGESGIVYLDEVQVIAAKPAIKLAYGNTRQKNPTADFDIASDSTGWAFEDTENTTPGTYDISHGNLNIHFAELPPSGMKITGKYAEGSTLTLAVPANRAAGMKVNYQFSRDPSNAILVLKIFGTSSTYGTTIEEIAGTAAIQHLPSSGILEATMLPDKPYIYGQLVAKSLIFADYQFDDMYLQLDEANPYLWDSSLF